MSRADKRKKASKHAKRLNGTVSETESDHSRTTDRDSTELKAAPPVVALPPPEKGILKKKHGRSMDEFRVATPQELLPLQKRSAVTIPRMSAHYSDEFKVPSQDERCGDKLVDESDSSEDDDDDSDDAMTPPGGNETRSDGVVSPDCPVRPSWEVSRDAGATGNRILKLKNLNELLRQIDEQFNVVLKKTGPVASPAGSNSDAELVQRGSSDYQTLEEGLGVGFSPPQRSPMLSPSSPDPLLNPGDIRNFPPTSPMSENYEKPCRFRKRKPAPTLPVPTAVSPTASSSHSGSSHGYTALQTAPPEENVWQPRISQSATTVAPSNIDKGHGGATMPRQQPLPFTAVPYRSTKITGGTKPVGSSPAFYRQNRSTVPPPPPVRGCSVPAVKQQAGTIATDGQLDDKDKDETIIVREIPKPSTLRLSSRQRATQSRCLSSPDDVDV